MALMFLYLVVWSQKEVSIQLVVGVLVELESVSSENLMELSIFGILWINHINGLCNIQLVQ